MSILDTYFHPDTMSVHFKVGVSALTKSGKPGAWKAEMSGKVHTQEELVFLANSLLAEVQ
jgi:predicted PilT family ATPase